MSVVLEKEVAENPQPPQSPSIRSFVRRQGRVSNAQKRYYSEMMSAVGIPFQPQLLDLARVFGRDAPKILEIGCGKGETTAEIAATYPENDYLGIEVHTPGVGSLCKQIAERGLSNLRICQHDAVEVLRAMIAPEALAGIHIFFPDPWPKKRHHKRRLIQPPLVALLASRLAPGAYIHCATDWENYALQMLEVLAAEPSLENSPTALQGGFVPRPPSRPRTKFEERGLRLGHGVWDVLFHKPLGRKSP